MTRVRCVRSGVHSALIRILREQKIPKKKRTTDEIAAYRIKRKPGLNIEVSEVKHPLSGKREERVLVSSGKDDIKTILLRRKHV